MRIPLPPVAALAVMFSVIGSAEAQIVTSTSVDAPTENIIWTTMPETGLTNFNWNGPSARRDIGISFRAPADGSFDSFTLQMNTMVNANGTNFTVRIFETNAFNTNPLTGSLKETLSGTLPVGLTSGDYLTFDLNTEVAITESRFYTFVLTLDEASTGKQLGFTVGGADIPNSQLWASDSSGANFERNGGSKVLLYVHHTAIPEPGTTALLGMACISLLGVVVRRSRRKEGR